MRYFYITYIGVCYIKIFFLYNKNLLFKKYIR